MKRELSIAVQKKAALNAMLIAVTVTICTAAITMFTSTTANAQEISKTTPYIDVNATASREVVPDEIYLRILLSEEPSKGKIKVEEQQKEVVKVLKELDIPVENLSVEEMSSNLHTFFFKRDQTWATKSLQLKIRSAKEMASVFSRLNQAGISEISLVNAKVSKELENQVREELMREAAAKAKRNAEILTEALGTTIGKPLYIAQRFSYTPLYNYRRTKSTLMMANYDGASSAEEDDIEMGKTQLSLSVECKFEIK